APSFPPPSPSPPRYVNVGNPRALYDGIPHTLIHLRLTSTILFTSLFNIRVVVVYGPRPA
ncbi:hypothetical protein HK102_009405, partial [Quaeritorhiza haematococci]